MAVARVTLRINDAAMERIGMDYARDRVAEVTRAIYNRANILTPVRTGRLRSANQFRNYVTGLTARGEVFNNLDYAAAVHNGARPRVIHARTRPWKGGGRLRFKNAGGATIFRHSVNWPGTKPRPWLATAMLQIAPQYGFVVENL